MRGQPAGEAALSWFLDSSPTPGPLTGHRAARHRGFRRGGRSSLGADLSAFVRLQSADELIEPVDVDTRLEGEGMRLLGRSSSNASRAIGHDQQTAVDFELVQGRQMTPHEGQDGASARCGRSKDDTAMVAVRRV